MEASELWAAVAIGLAGGLVSGMLGIGGGLVFVPGFTLLLGLPIHTAAGTSLLSIAIGTGAGTWRHDRYGRVNRRDALSIGLVAPLGVVAGVVVAQTMPEHALRIAIACVMMYSGGSLARRALLPLDASESDSARTEAPAPARAVAAASPADPAPAPIPAGRPPVVVALGLEPLRLLDGQGRIDCMLEAPAPDEVPLLVDLLEAGVGVGGGVVAIVPEWFPVAGRASFALARRSLDEPLVAVHRTACPPLGAAVLAAYASALGGRLAGHGLVASVLGRVERRLAAVAWLGSAAGLRDPRPPAHLRLLSLAPGTGFLVVAGGHEPAVHRARARSLDLQPSPATTVAVSARRADPERLATAVPQLVGLPSVAVAPTPAGPSWWGTGRLVEAVVYPSDPDGLARDLLGRLDPWDCAWCGQQIAASPCPCCMRHGPPLATA
jgi:uncharacterized membrane protein YfcA